MAHKKVLEAAIALFAERGIDATSMDAICEVSGVSKASLYKHWPDKDALCMEVLIHLHGLDKRPPAFDSGDTRADLIAQLSYEPVTDRREMRDRILPHLMAYAAAHREFGDQWRTRVVERPRKQLRRILERGNPRRRAFAGYRSRSGRRIARWADDVPQDFRRRVRSQASKRLRTACGGRVFGQVRSLQIVTLCTRDDRRNRGL